MARLLSSVVENGEMEVLEIFLERDDVELTQKKMMVLLPYC